MKSFFIVLITCLLVVLTSLPLQAQVIKDYKTKTTANHTERSKILDLLRAEIYRRHKQEVQFVVEKLNVQGEYAWFQGQVQRKDGKEFEIAGEADCCHVEALLRNKNGKWYIDEMAAFTTDVWWDGIWEEKKLSRQLFVH
ncbi:MAG: hypothetical protein EOP54_10790 [Sphingobacteriales bacterium]|nr:MAG: hypothetical protein EOP54_10790 [Sphingobacteriales bacterium]